MVDQVEERSKDGRVKELKGKRDEQRWRVSSHGRIHPPDESVGDYLKESPMGVVNLEMV